MNNLNKIAYCGLYCGACKIYICTQNNTIDQLSKTTGIPVDLLKCSGCRSNETSLYCRNCAMKKCNIKKGIFSCTDCEEIPCPVLEAFESDQHLHHKGVIGSLVLLGEIGDIKWLNEQENRWTCKKCETVYSWYDMKCPSCGSKTDGLK